MKPEIKNLVEIYGNREKYRQRITDLSKKKYQQPRTDLYKDRLSDFLEKHEIESKIDFGKNRQRAELLKQNGSFLNELSGIKNRLGEKFFKLMEEEITVEGNISEAALEKASKDALLKSDFAEPKIIIRNVFIPEDGADPDYVFYLPDTPMLEDDSPESEIDLERDPLFDSPPLEWVILDELDPDCIWIGTPLFMLQCKEEVFKRYLDRWNAFLTKWHISTSWNGDVSCLHNHTLPSVIVEHDVKNYNLPVVIRVGAWAILEDVKEAWATVERTMKEARVYRERESENFLRDYIWYQLNKKDAMSPLSIARFWAEKFPKEFDLEVIEKVTRDENTFEDVPMEERLEEVLSDDPKMAELRGKFIEARRTFIRTGLKDKVKKSIKKTEEKIKRLGSEEWDRNRSRLFKKTVR